ncbi:MAG: hypothetical protein IJ751_00935 [Oscillospiraceae bacterium]|nr:hypothetical protein [Oscillospiraceae bacterium]
MSKKKKKQKQRTLPLERMPQISNVVSTTDCTGLIPGASLEEDEVANELSLYSNSLPPVWNDSDLTPNP